MTTTNWVIDASHSEIQFKVKHLVITTVTGAFNDFSGTVEAGDDTFENAKISFEASTASINTNSEQRDTHLKSADFFDIEKLKLKISEFINAGAELNPSAELDNIKKYFSEYNRRNLISVNALEKEAKIPPTSFRQFLDGGRKFPIKHITKIVVGEALSTYASNKSISLPLSFMVCASFNITRLKSANIG